MTDDYRFSTARLDAREWHDAERDGSVHDLPAIVGAMLTEPVTRWLPTAWHGPYTRARAEGWIADRDAEGPVLVVTSRETRVPLGLVLLFEERTADGIEVRVGYLLAEHAWGSGYGSELVAGLVAWCRERRDVRAIVGGVAPENAASIRVLERHGFVRSTGDEPTDELIYRLRIPKGGA